MKLLETIVEVTAKPYAYTWDFFYLEGANGEFTTENGAIIEFDVEYNEEWEQGTRPDPNRFEHHEIVFSGRGPKGSRTTKQMDSGNPFRVFATIQAMMQDYIDRYGNQIEMIKFSADKSAGKLGRSKLYTRYAKNWNKMFTGQKWQSYVHESSGAATIIYAINKNAMSKKNIDYFDSAFGSKFKKV